MAKQTDQGPPPPPRNPSKFDTKNLTIDFGKIEGNTTKITENIAGLDAELLRLKDEEKQLDNYTEEEEQLLREFNENEETLALIKRDREEADKERDLIFKNFLNLQKKMRAREKDLKEKDDAIEELDKKEGPILDRKESLQKQKLEMHQIRNDSRLAFQSQIAAIEKQKEAQKLRLIDANAVE